MKETYPMSKAFRYYTIFGILMSVVLILFMAFVSYYHRDEADTTTIILTVILCLFAAFGFFYLLFHLRRMDSNVVEVSDEYISNSYSSGKPILRWSEVRRIEEHPLKRRLRLYDLSGHNVVKVEYQLQNLEVLIKQILQRVPLEILPSIHQNKLRASLPRITIWVYIILFYGVLFGILLHRGYGFLDALVMVSLVALIGFSVGMLFEKNSLEFKNDSISLRRGLQKFQINLNEIEDIRVVVVQKGANWGLDVEVYKKNGKTLFVCPPGNSVLAVYRKLKELLINRRSNNK